MKNFTSKIALVLLSVAFFLFAGCDKVGHKSFSITVHEVGPEYVELMVQGGDVIRMAYMMDTKEKLVKNPQEVFRKGTEITVRGGEVLRISRGLEENTQYYLYACAALNEMDFSEIITLPFKTNEYNFTSDKNNFLTVVDQYYDGYKMRVTFPKETKERNNALRFNQCCIMMYNYMREQNNDYFSLLYNGQTYSVADTTLVYAEDTNWYETGSDSDGDGLIDWDTRYNPISPGEPVVFVAGEFSWMEDSPKYENEYFQFPAGWVAGYYMPLIDTTYYSTLPKEEEQSSMGVIDWDYTHPLDEYWTGAFQRKHFRVKEPSLLDAGVDVKCVKATPINLTLEFYPEEGVEQYAFGIFDDETYRNQVLPLLNGNEDWMQWAVTSYFAAYTFGTKVASGAVSASLTSFYYQSAITEQTPYHVFVTAMGDAAGTSQSFQKFTFSTTERTLYAPEVLVTPVGTEDGDIIYSTNPKTGKPAPYAASFNIKCTTYADNPLMEAYYAANYSRDWKLALNGGSTYFSILNGNNQFTAEELAQINSKDGYTISFPSVDGETTRLAVLGYNYEYTPNDLTGFKKDEMVELCPAVAEVTTPYVDAKEPVDPIYYEDLIGEWTATATLQQGASSNKVYTHKSKITIAADLYDYPSSLSPEVYQIYKEIAKMDESQVDAYWYQFKELAEVFTQKRLYDQNRLICLGWLDDDTYSRLDTRTPYDLFVDKKYSSVDVSSIYNDFGPKWYIEAVQDSETGQVRLVAPVDANFLPPSANWSVPFYLSGMEPKNYYTVTYAEDGNLCFPVEYNAEKDEITIHPFEHNKVKYYPNMVGIDASMGTAQTILENPVVSKVVLTRGWTEPTKSQSSLKASGSGVKAQGDFPMTVYKSRTQLNAAPELKNIEMEIPTKEQIKERADKLVERFVNQSR